MNVRPRSRRRAPALAALVGLLVAAVPFAPAGAAAATVRLGVPDQLVAGTTDSLYVNSDDTVMHASWSLDNDDCRAEVVHGSRHELWCPLGEGGSLGLTATVVLLTDGGYERVTASATVPVVAPGEVEFDLIAADRSVPAGEAVDLTAYVQDEQGHGLRAPYELAASTDGGTTWTTVASGVTDQSGDLRFAEPVPATTLFRLAVAGGGPPVDRRVYAAGGVAGASLRILEGGPIVFRAEFVDVDSLAPATGTALLQRPVSDGVDTRWVTVASAPLVEGATELSDGDRPGRYRVLLQGDQDYPTTETLEVFAVAHVDLVARVLRRTPRRVQVRATRLSGAPEQLHLTLQAKPRGTRRWHRVATLLTNQRGYATQRVRVRRPTRYRWVMPGSYLYEGGPSNTVRIRR